MTEATEETVTGHAAATPADEAAMVVDTPTAASTPLYLLGIRIPWEWLTLPCLLLPAVLIAADEASPDAVTQCDDSLMGWRAKPPSSTARALAMAGRRLEPMSGGYSANPLVDALVRFLASKDGTFNSTEFDSDLWVRIHLKLSRPIRWQEDVGLSDDIFTDADRGDR